MDNSGIINTSQSADLITFTITSDGKEISGIYEILSIVVNKEVNRIPTAQILLNDGESATQDFPLSNEDIFDPGKIIEIKAGYHNDEETIFKGIVIKHSIRIREGRSNLIIECKDKAVAMTIGKRSTYFYETKDSEIFETLLGEHGLEKDVESTDTSHPEIVQYDITNWDFMVTRANVNGQLCFVDNGKITIAKPDYAQEPLETIAFGTSMLDFDAEIDARLQLDKITSYGWDFSKQELLEMEASDPSISLNGNLTNSKLAKVLEIDNYQLRHGGSLTDSELQAWADAKMVLHQLAKVRGRVKFQGIPSVKPNTTLELKGVGDKFSGKVYVTAIRHVLKEGNWTCDVQFGINPEWFSEKRGETSYGASGILGGIQGLQVGIVSQLEEDPDGEERILVQIPIVNNEEKGIWCRVASLDAGENRGFFFRPEIEDEVIIGFINGDPNDAVVLGMLHSSAKPAPFVASDDNNEKGYVSREELKMTFDDELKSMAFTTPAGKSITMDEDADELIITDDHSNVILMNGDGISLESNGDINIKAARDVNIEGTNVSIAANAEFKAEGSAGAEVSTSAVAVLKGSLVQIN